MMIVWKKNCLNLECFLTHETYFDIDGLNLYSELKVLKEVLQINENCPINALNYIKRLEPFSKCMYCFQNITNYTCYSCFCRKKFFKIKINKIIFKIDNVLRKIKWISYVVIRAQNHALGLGLCPRTFRWSEKGRMVIRNSNLKSRKKGTNGGRSKGESLLEPNQRSSSVYSSH